MLGRQLRLAVAAVFLCTLVHADCLRDHRSSQTSGILVKDFTIIGTRSLGSEALAHITSQLVGSCFNDSSEELQERIRALFQDRGYFAAEVKDLKIKAGDALGMPRPVALEAEISEGVRYRLRKINISGSQAFTAKMILSRFSLHQGDAFERNKLAGTLESVRKKMYAPAGFLEMFMVPDTQLLSDGTVVLNLIMHEGPQYHMGKLEVFADNKAADKLRAGWQLSEGSIFDANYVERYIAQNRSMLPKGFNAQNVQLVTNCPEALVTVRVLADFFNPDAQKTPKNIPCDPAGEGSR
jgi:outer membrane protein assembly factor BamA